MGARQFRNANARGCIYGVRLKCKCGADFLADWQALVAQVRANQPTWATPLITTTGLLLHRYRFDLAEQHVGNGNQTTILDGGKGVDLIVSDRTEI